jgi:hypothetical protein
VRQRTPTQNLYDRSDLNQGDADSATNNRTGATGASENLQRGAGHVPAAINWGSERLARNLSATCVAPRVVNDRFDGINNQLAPDWLNGTWPGSSMAAPDHFLLPLIDQIDRLARPAQNRRGSTWVAMSKPMESLPGPRNAAVAHSFQRPATGP